MNQHRHKPLNLGSQAALGSKSFDLFVAGWSNWATAHVHLEDNSLGDFAPKQIQLSSRSGVISLGRKSVVLLFTSCALVNAHLSRNGKWIQDIQFKWMAKKFLLDMNGKINTREKHMGRVTKVMTSEYFQISLFPLMIFEEAKHPFEPCK